MKAYLLAAAVAAGMLCTAGTADAQYRYRGYSYSYPSYGYSTYTVPSYSYAAPSYYNYSGVTTSSYYTPAAPMVYPGGGYYDPNAWAPTYSGYGSGYGSYYGGYPAYSGGVNVYPSSGIYYGGRSVWRW